MAQHCPDVAPLGRPRLRGTGLAAAAVLALLLFLGAGRRAAADISGVVYNPGTGHYYKWVSSSGYWSACKSGAEALGGYLATVTSDAERTWLDANIRPTNQTCYLGGTDESSENTWVWVSGETWSYTYWNGGEPNNSGNEDYLMVNSNGTWNDIHGSYSLNGYIVEWNVNPNIPPPPAAPTGLTASFSPEGTVLLAWTDNSTNEDNFQVFRKSSSGNYATIASPAKDTVAYEDRTPLGPATTFTYRVRSVNLGGASDYTNEASVTTPDAPVPPAMPTDLSVTDAGPRSVSFQWTDNSDDEIQFQVFRGAPGATLEILGIASANVTSYADTGLVPDTAYVYGVRAVNTHGASLTARIQASTVATLDVTTLRGDLTDSPKVSRDKVKVQARYDFLPTASDDTVDPVEDGITLRVGPEAAPLTLRIPPMDGAWKVRGVKATWKTPKESLSKLKVVVVLDTRTVTLTGSKLHLAAAAANPMRFSATIGGESGSRGEDWLEKKPGRFQLR